MKSKRVGHGLRWAVCSALLSATTVMAAAGPRETTAATIGRLQSLALPEMVQVAGGMPRRGVMDPGLAGASGRVDVFARLAGESVAGSNELVSREQVLAEQAAFINRILTVAPNAEVMASVQLATNGVVLRVDARDLPQLSRDMSITRLVAVGDYRQDLSETVPYIGADTAHQFGARGQGVRVAVIDSGIDYTHAALGGPGTQAAYEAAWAPLPPAGAPAIPVVPAGPGYLVVNDPGTTADDGLFPSAKVVGGYDFVGERWPNNAVGTTPAFLEPDPDPIGAPDNTTFGGHGTHVGDIIAGKLGVAPAAKLYAVKACSAPATSCSGVALIQAMDFALDPNFDGRIRDRVDIINMSLGSPYGQPFDDDLSLAVDNATKVGVLTVASAGNSADKQFITGSPAAASSALSVAQTAVPSSTLQLMTFVTPPLGNRAAVFQPWSGPLTADVQGAVTVAPAGTAKRVGCVATADPTVFTNPFGAGELTGQIVFVDRGLCPFSVKIQHIQAAGGILGIIGLITPEAPFAGAFGGGTPPTIPGYMINQADGNVIRAGGAVVSFSVANNVSLAGSLASTSSRGPRFDDNIVKPEIGAPGASISADSGTFTATSAFGGTSGAAPMVSGAAAILKAARPFLSARDIKQLLINTAETDIFQPSSSASVLPDQLAPITRIGGGEVRVDRALFSPVIVSDVTGDKVSRVHGAMSFGYLDASKQNQVFIRKLEVENRSFFPLVYDVTPTLRFQDDKDTGAVTMNISPSKIIVHPFGRREVTVKLTVDGTKLRNNLMNAGSLGNAIGPLTANEYDGYVVFKGHHHEVTMPWHILPRKSADVVAKLTGGKLPAVDPVTGAGLVPLENKGVGDAQIFAYSILGTGPDVPNGGRGEQMPNPTIRAAAVNTFLTPAGFCEANPNFLWEFVFNMHERKASPVGTIHEVDIDTTGDGNPDFAVVSQDLAGITSLSDGRQVTMAYNLTTGVGSAFFFVEHATNSSNVILRVCGNQLGLNQASIGVPMTAQYFAQSWYFGQDDFSALGPFRLTPFGEEFTAAVPGDLLVWKQKADLAFTQWALFPQTDAHVGILLVNNSDFGAANRGGATKATEGLVLRR
jgi:subtilisin family serine protease